jgi:hypothetical protein
MQRARGAKVGKRAWQRSQRVITRVNGGSQAGARSSSGAKLNALGCACVLERIVGNPPQAVWGPPVQGSVRGASTKGDGMWTSMCRARGSPCVWAITIGFVPLPRLGTPPLCPLFCPHPGAVTKAFVQLASALPQRLNRQKQVDLPGDRFGKAAEAHGGHAVPTLPRLVQPAPRGMGRPRLSARRWHDQRLDQCPVPVS